MFICLQKDKHILQGNYNIMGHPKHYKNGFMYFA